MRTPIGYFLVVSAMLFSIGTVGVLVRRNALIIFMSVELQLNAVNLALVTFSRMHNQLNGQVLAFFSMVVAAAEVVVGLAIIVTVFRRRHSASVAKFTISHSAAWIALRWNSIAIALPTLTGANTQNTTLSSGTYFPSSVPGAVPSGSGGSSSCSFV